MSKQNLLYAGLALIVVFSFFMLFEPEHTNVTKITPVEKIIYPEIQAEEETPAPKKIVKERPDSAIKNKKLQKVLPLERDLRSEIAENPHQTSHSLIKFAETLGLMMEKALQDEKEAGSLVRGLDHCVSDNSVAVSARVLCLTKAEQLAETYPDLNSKVREIQQNADADVVELKRRKDSFIK